MSEWFGDDGHLTGPMMEAVAAKEDLGAAQRSIEQHLRVCLRCRDDVRAMRDENEAFRAELASAENVEALVRKAPDGPSTPQRIPRSRRWRWWLESAVAFLVLGVTAVFMVELVSERSDPSSPDGIVMIEGTGLFYQEKDGGDWQGVNIGEGLPANCRIQAPLSVGGEVQLTSGGRLELGPGTIVDVVQGQDQTRLILHCGALAAVGGASENANPTRMEVPCRGWVRETKDGRIEAEVRVREPAKGETRMAGGFTIRALPAVAVLAASMNGGSVIEAGEVAPEATKVAQERKLKAVRDEVARLEEKLELHRRAAEDCRRVYDTSVRTYRKEQSLFEKKLSTEPQLRKCEQEVNRAKTMLTKAKIALNATELEVARAKARLGMPDAAAHALRDIHGGGTKPIGDGPTKPDAKAKGEVRYEGSTVSEWVNILKETAGKMEHEDIGTSNASIDRARHALSILGVHALGELTKELKTASGRWRNEIEFVMSQMKVRQRDIPVLLKLAKNEHFAVRRAVVTTLASVKGRHPEIVKALEDALKDRDLAVAEAAEKVLAERRDLDRRRSAELIQSARSCLAAKKYAEAVRFYEQARAVDPDNATIQEGLARCRDALKSDELTAKFQKHLAAAQAALKSGKYKEAMAEYKSAAVLKANSQAVKEGLDACRRAMRKSTGIGEVDIDSD